MMCNLQTFAHSNARKKYIKNTTTMRFPEGSQVINCLMTIVPNRLVDGEIKERMSRPYFATASIGDKCSKFKENTNEPSLASALSSKAAENRQVSFGKLEVRYYPIILGDHPDCSEGPPVRFFFRLNDFLCFYIRCNFSLEILQTFFY